MASRRALHFVLKIGNLAENIRFFRGKLGMQVLRHESFDKGCEAACNGPYASRWTKTMIGYGSEDSNFVLELTFNYTVSSYERGNDLQYIKVRVCEQIFEQNKSDGGVVEDGEMALKSPDGYTFLIRKSNDLKPDVTQVCLASVDLQRSVSYWKDLLKMRDAQEEVSEAEVVLHYGSDQASLRLRQINGPVEHKTAFGRIAFSCPSAELKPLQAGVEKENLKVLVPYVSLDTPGKATVEVVILADPDGHEICFVGDEGFRELSKVDPEAGKLLEESLAEIAAVSDKIKTRAAE